MPTVLGTVLSNRSSFTGQIGGESTLIANISDTETTIPLSNNSIFPQSGTVQIGNEFITYTGKVSTFLTGCQRGQFFSTATSHDSGDVVTGAFVSVPDLNSHSNYHIMYFCSNSTTIKVQLSREGTSWNDNFKSVIEVFPNVSNSTNGIKGPLYFRLIVLSTSGQLTDVDIATSFGRYNQPEKLNVFPKIDLAEGNIPGQANYFMIGRNSTVGPTLEDIWPTGGTISYLTTAETIDVVSTSANDTVSGTGGWMVKIIGLDNNFDEIDEFVALNGTTVVTTTQAFLRINNVTLVQAGSSGWNEGNIILTASTSATVQCQVAPETSISESAHFTVPRGKNFYLVQVELNSARVGTSSSEVLFRGYVRYRALDPNYPFLLYFERKIETSVQNDITINFPLTVRIDEMSDIVGKVSSVEAGTECRVRAYGVLVDKV